MTPVSNTSPNLLLLSNSRNPAGEYLVHAREAIQSFAGPRRKALFFPFAGVTVDWDDYTAMAQNALQPLGFELTGAHTCADVHAAIAQTQLLLVGGGNTFRLLYEMRKRGCLSAVQAAVSSGTHYIGWSAGSVLASPSICTTNDMPIVDPKGLDALGMVPFQLNCHYNNVLPPGHQGESRNQRLAEYLVLNPAVPILALPEGNWLEVRGNKLCLFGPHSSVLFKTGRDPADIASGLLEPL